MVVVPWAGKDGWQNSCEREETLDQHDEVEFRDKEMGNLVGVMAKIEAKDQKGGRALYLDS